MTSKPVTETAALRDNWERHWHDYASSAESNPAQTFRRKLILSLLGEKPARVLDIGSGQGDLAALLTATFPGAQVLGLEISASGVCVARAKVPEAEFIQSDLLEEQKPGADRRNWATHAVCSEVLEHLDEPERLLVNVKAWLAPGCRLIVTVPGGPISEFDRHIGHRLHYTPKDLRRLLERAGFHVETAHGAGYPFFNFYRGLVVARGKRLIADAAGEPSLGVRLAMRTFGFLFRLNTCERGWQVVAVAIADSVTEH